MQIGRCQDSLIQLCTKLTAKACLLKYKYIHVRHQASNTHSQNLVNHINRKIGVVITKYCHLFTVLNALDPEGKPGWCSEFLELQNQDI